MLTAEQSAAIPHAEPEHKAGAHQEHQSKFPRKDVYTSPQQKTCGNKTKKKKVHTFFVYIYCM